MKERKENKNAARSKRLIREAFLRLLEHKDISDITISSLVREAGITRATFYAHYSCIGDLAEIFADELAGKLADILSSFDYQNNLLNPAPLLFQASRFLEENEKQYRALLASTPAEDFLKKLKRIFIDYLVNDKGIPEEIRDRKDFRLMLEFLACGIGSLYTEWLKGSLECSVYDIPVVISDFMSSGAQKFLH